VYSYPAPVSFENLAQLKRGLAVMKAMATLKPGQVVEPSLDAIGHMVGPVGEAAVDGIKTQYGVGSPRFFAKKDFGDGEKRNAYQVTSPTERAVLVPMLRLLDADLKEEGNKVYVSPAAHSFYRTVLVPFSVELARYMDPVMTREQADNEATYLLRQFSGILKETPYQAKRGTIEE